MGQVGWWTLTLCVKSHCSDSHGLIPLHLKSLTPSKFLMRSGSAKQRQRDRSGGQGKVANAGAVLSLWQRNVNFITPFSSKRAQWWVNDFNCSLWAKCHFPHRLSFFSLSYLVHVPLLLPPRHSGVWPAPSTCLDPLPSRLPSLAWSTATASELASSPTKPLVIHSPPQCSSAVPYLCAGMCVCVGGGIRIKWLYCLHPEWPPCS